MPRSCEPLTATEVKHLRPASQAYRRFDGLGLYVEVAPNGSLYWRLKYRVHKSEKRLALGTYPEVSLAQARLLRDDARKLVAQGKDPAQVRRVERVKMAAQAGNTFEKVAREWLGVHGRKLTPDTAKRALRLFEKDVFPFIGTRPISEIITPELLAVVRNIEQRGGRETAHRVVQRCGAVFRFAAQTGLSDNNPAQNLRGALEPVQSQHYRYLKEADLPEFLRKLEANDGQQQPITLCAIKLLMLTFVRTKELRGAKWSEFDLIRGVWTIDPERMKVKGRDPHKVPLSRQAIEVIEELRLYSGNRELLFPNEKRPLHPMSENTVLFALYRMGYHSRATGHGFRSTASTILNEHGFPRDHIERQLAHGDTDEIRAAYNHAEYLADRAKMMQWYADYLDKLAGRGKVIEFPTPKAA